MLRVLTSSGLQLWDVSTQGWSDRACRIAGRNLTYDEWLRYLGKDKPYAKVCPQWPLPADPPAPK